MRESEIKESSETNQKRKNEFSKNRPKVSAVCLNYSHSSLAVDLFLFEFRAGARAVNLRDGTVAIKCTCCVSELVFPPSVFLKIFGFKILQGPKSKIGLFGSMLLSNRVLPLTQSSETRVLTEKTRGGNEIRPRSKRQVQITTEYFIPSRARVLSELFSNNVTYEGKHCVLGGAV